MSDGLSGGARPWRRAGYWSLASVGGGYSGNVRRATAVERRCGSLGGKDPEGEKPARASGAKQTRKAFWGVSRREVEKTWGRNVAAVGIHCDERTRDVDGAKRQEDLMEGAGVREGSGGLVTPYSVGGPKPLGG
jgi:hypothetical protein